MKQNYSLACLPVESFFNVINWEGLANPTRSQQSDPQALVMGANFQSSWPCLSVREFFNRSNWQGLPLETSHPEPDVPAPLESALRLTLSVQQFLQLIRWESTPQIGTFPKRPPVAPPKVTPASDRNLDDLSKLF